MLSTPAPKRHQGKGRLATLLFLLAVSASALFLTSCGSSGTSTISSSASNPQSSSNPPTQVTLTSIDISPGGPTLPQDTTEPLAAFGTYSDGTIQNLTTRVTWTSSDPAVATVSDADPHRGLARAVAPGQCTITATLDDVSGSTLLTVTAATLESIELDPAGPTVANGFSLQFTATGIYSDGTTEDLTTEATWTSSNPAVATVSSSDPDQGLAQTVDVGQATITATFDGVSGSTVLTVSPAVLTSIELSPGSPSIPKGISQQFEATGIFSDGTTEDISTQVTWTSSDTTIATISNKGFAKGVGVGQSTITASLHNLSDSTVLTVSAATVQSIAVTPGTPSIAKGTSQKFRATGTFSDGTTEDLTTQVLWHSSATDVATISSTPPDQGVARGVGVGQSTIQATLSGVSGSTVLTVSPAVLVSVAVSPSNPWTPKGTTQQFAATATFSDGTTQDVRTRAVWTSSAPNIATISNAAPNQGLARGVGEGHTTITATFEGLSGSTVLAVSAAALKSLAVTPPTAIKAPSTRLRLQCIGTFTDDSTKDLTTEVTWSSSDSTVASISNLPGDEGLVEVNGRVGQSATLTAFRSGVTGTSTLRVGQFAFVANAIANSVSAFTVNDDGSLAVVAGSPFPTESNPYSVTIDPSGRFAYVPDFNVARISAFTIGSNGSLAPVPGSPFATRNEPSAIAADPSGRFVYVTTVDKVSTFGIGSSGALTWVSDAMAAAGTTIAMHPSGDFAYVGFWASSIWGYQVNDTNGALRPVAACSFDTQGPRYVTVDPTGRFAYAANPWTGTIAVLSLNGNTGAMTTVGHVASGKFTESVAVDPTGRFAYAANWGDDTLSAYTINGTSGMLTPVTGSPYKLPAGSAPRSVTVDATGRYAFVTNWLNDTVATFAINRTTGALAPRAVNRTGARPLSVSTSR